MENNQIELMGKIVGAREYSHTMYGSDFYKLQINVTRTSGVNDELKIVYNNDIFNIGDDIEGKTVSLIGEIRTRNIQDDKGSHLDIFVYVLDLEILESDNEDYAGVNNAFLHGYIAKKSPVRKTPGGRTICDIVLACNRRYNKSSYIPIVTWGVNAIKVDKMDVGTEIKIYGRLQSREYFKQSDNMVHKIYEYSAQSIEIV